MKIWDYLSGKKRTIALIYWTILLPSLMIWYPEGIPPTLMKITSIAGVVLSALGLGHAYVKHRTHPK